MDDMIPELIRNHVIMSSIFLTGGVSVILQWFAALSLKGYVKASSNMKTTGKKSMVNMKNQFEAIYEMNSKVHNMDAYVDKYLLKLKFIGITYNGWERLSFITAGVITILSLAAAFLGYKSSENDIFYAEILFSYGITMTCLFMFHHIFKIKMKKQQIHIQLVDYLENYLANRLIKGRNDKWNSISDEIDDAFEEDVKKYDNKEDSQVVAEYNDEGGERRTMEEDMDMLKRLIREMDAKKEGDAVGAEVAASTEVSEEQTDAELLEEFVQSFFS